MMAERETSQAIAESAEAWVARLDRECEDPCAQEELEEWLAGDDRRRGALFRAQSAWAMLDRASVLRSGVIEHSSEVPEIDRSANLRRRVGRLMGVAAVLAVMVFSFALLDTSQHVQTETGEILQLALDDGSFAAVNTQSSLDVSIEEKQRRVMLDEGEAWFRVAKDRARPFVVEIGNARVRAVGTAFAVHKMSAGAEVFVTEGTVEVWIVGAEAEKRLVSAGSKTFVAFTSGAGVVSEAPEAIDRALAWRSGQIILEGDTLAQAAAEFNRYNVVQIEIPDPELAEEKIVGRFRTNEPDAFARAATSVLGVKADFAEHAITLHH